MRLMETPASRRKAHVSQPETTEKYRSQYRGAIFVFTSCMPGPNGKQVPFVDKQNILGMDGAFPEVPELAVGRDSMLG
jgi:hypothetical protein